ncbi:permease family-domain-containing protein [Mycena rebaudengoi]|nr:permease family-domain-containing protein [Mycena rebaudengoi]
MRSPQHLPAILYPFNADLLLHIPMKPLPVFVVLLAALFPFPCASQELKRQKCRNIPGSPSHPQTLCEPSGGTCTDAQWTSALFRNTIPGAMNQVNWEQGYDLTPPSLCLRNSTICGQGDVPVYSVEAVKSRISRFASAHNLRLVVKASGHDLLGRSTAPHALLIRTSNFQTSPSRTPLSGVHLQTVYQAAKAVGRIVVGGTAATVCAAGGYLQGGGHSALSPTLGLAADNALEFQIVVASGELLKVNSISHPDLFYALRGGGAGSWGVLVSATVRTFPTFNATFSLIVLTSSSTPALGALAAVHAQHIFDLDPVRGGQYFYLQRLAPNGTAVFFLTTFLPNLSVEAGTAMLQPFLAAARAIPDMTVASEVYLDEVVNDLLFQADDAVGENFAAGSRLIPEQRIGISRRRWGGYTKSCGGGGSKHLRNPRGGRPSVSERPHLIRAASRLADLLLINKWPDSAPLATIKAVRTQFRDVQLPILAQIAGSGSDVAAYSNEADVLEADFQTTFFGPNYAKLSAIKRRYDPKDLFIVGAGVGSERWDQWGSRTRYPPQEGWLGNYDYVWLCMPSWPFSKTSHEPPILCFGCELPLVLAIASGLQHALAMLAGLITPPIIFASALNLDSETSSYMISASLIGCGILSLVQMSRIPLFGGYYLGTGLISVVGTQFLDAVYGERHLRRNVSRRDVLLYRRVQMAPLLESLSRRIWEGLGFSMAFFPARVLKRIFPPMVTGTVVLLIGAALIGDFRGTQLGRRCKQLSNLPHQRIFQLCPTIFAPRPLPWASPEFIGLGFLSFISIVLTEFFGSPFLKNISVIVGLAVGCIVAVLAVYVSLAMEAIGDITASAEVSRVDVRGVEFDSRIQGGVLSDGLGGFVSALFTVTPLSIFAQNNGVIAITRCANRAAGRWCCVFLILFGILGKISGALLAIPNSVLGGVTTFLFASVAVSGLRVLSFNQYTRRDRFVLSAALSFGIGDLLVPGLFTHLFDGHPISGCGDSGCDTEPDPAQGVRSGTLYRQEEEDGEKQASSANGV